MCVVDTRVWGSLLWWPWGWKRYEKAMEVLGCARLLPQPGGWPGCERQALWGRRPGQETPATSLRIERPEGSAPRCLHSLLKAPAVCHAAQAPPVNSHAKLFGPLGTGPTAHAGTLNPSLTLQALCDVCLPVLRL